MRTTSITLMIACSLVGCMPHQQEPTMVSEARSYSRAGNEAYREGDLESSKQAYGQALKRHHAIDDSVGIIRDLINLAVVSKASGSSADASECLDAADRYMAALHASGSTSRDSTELNELLLEVGWMRAYLYCDAGHLEKARHQLSQTSKRYGAPSRRIKGRFLNLEARLDLEEGNPTASLSTASRALSANKRVNDSAEVADSHRIIGRALIGTGSPERAQASFEHALEIDREQGRPSKVVDDLLGIAEASFAAGNPDQARAAAERALLAARAAGDNAATSKAHQLLEAF